MFHPRPYGRFAEDIDLSPEDAAAVELLARRLTNFKTASELPALKRVATLPSGREAVAVDVGGVFRVMVSAGQPPEPRSTFDGVAPSAIPMLFSGVITRGMVNRNENQGVGIKLSEQSRRRLVSYDSEAELPQKNVDLQRFVIEYDAMFSYFLPEITGIFTFTQYVSQRPTWYSGAMCEVMQVVGGYGRLDLGELPDDSIERAVLNIPPRVQAGIKSELGSVRLPGYTGTPSRDGRFKCDYKHALTHAVGFDDEGDPWLIQVMPGKVHAMPLPLVPATTTTAFREWMEEVGDSEILTLLDRFGGLPTGEPFPRNDDIEIWRRAGAIIEICDTADFYDFSSMYPACGWSMNSKGSEGYNTCWGFADNGMKYAYGYKLTLKLAAAEDAGRLPASWDLGDPIKQDRLNSGLASLYAEIVENSPTNLAIKYKIRTLSGEDLLTKLDSNGANVEYWDRLEVDPIAAHTGSVRRVTGGPIYMPSHSPAAMGGLKFPTLRGEGCQSFDFTAPDYTGGFVRSDTVVFGCYVGDTLRTIRYFFDEREFEKEDQSTYEDIMIVGSWEKTTTFGSSGLQGYFYTNDFDDRQDLADSVSTEKITGTNLGYGEPLWMTPPLLFRVGNLSRARYFKHKIEGSVTDGTSIRVGVCVPVFARDCIQYAFYESTDFKSNSMRTEMGGVEDPTSYEFWTNDNIFHFMGATQNGNQGDPYPREGTPVYLDTMVRKEFPGSDFSDSGNWFGFNGGFMDVTGVVGPYTSRSSSHSAGGVRIGGKEPGFQPESSYESEENDASGRVDINIHGAESRTVHKREPEQWYFELSPVDAGGLTYFYRDATWNAIGDTDYTTIYEKNDFGERTQFGTCSLTDNKTAQHFIGVIHD